MTNKTHDRSVIRLAGKTLVISIPSTWAKQNNITKGQKIKIEETSRGLLLKASPKTATNNVTIDITGLQTSAIWHSITGAYASGAEQISINYKNKTTKHTREKKQILVATYISELTDSLIGMEITQQTTTSCIITELSAQKQEEFTAAYTRLIHTVSTMTAETMNALITSDEHSRELARNYEAKINKLHLFCLRQLNLSTNDIPTITAKTRQITNLEELADSLIWMLKHIKKINREQQIQAISITKLVTKIYETLQQNTINKLESFYAEKNKITDENQHKTEPFNIKITQIANSAMNIIQAGLSNPQQYDSQK